MHIERELLKELLIKPGHLTPEQFSAAEKEAEAQKKDIKDVLVDNDLIKDEQLGQLIAEQAGFSLVRLNDVQIDDNLFNLIPELVARKMQVVAFGRSKEGVKVGMVDPNDLETRHLIEKRVGAPVVPYFITKRDLTGVLARYKEGLGEEFSEILKGLKDPAFSQEERDEVTIKMVDTLLNYGYQSKASDIHIEPYKGKVVVRFRIDGVLHDVLDIPKDFLELILTRIKIMAKMRTDEHRAAQDGKFRLETPEGESADVRVSIVPVVEGENVVMRLLSAKNRQFGLIDLGLEDVDLIKVKKAAENPHGMILVTGPTGSGKTTTVYAILKILNIREVHISTIEDPVEYDIEGISQIQVDQKTNLTFAKGLRAIVRQDPDIIMVGEVRDKETAGIAVNSAMTGHLVLSTLHANNAATTLLRLLEMGVEPFFIASTVNIVVAQRLVRRICRTCRVSSNLTTDERKAVERDTVAKAILKEKSGKNLDKLLVYKGLGCKVCGNTGYSGRIGIFEALEMSDRIKDLVVKRAASDKIMKVAESEGMTIMMEDGIRKVLNGVTTLEEVLRVTKG